ncbi:caspase family protein [Profundibacter sp.]
MFFRLVVVILLFFSTTGITRAKSLALIIGNDSYQNVEPLQKARSDARGYAAFLGERGFDVTLKLDIGGRDMLVVLAEFLDRIATGDTVMFIYSGHGWSDGRQNYLVPVDIRASGSETLIAAESFALRNGVNGIIDKISQRSPLLTVAVVDACRNNPFSSPAGGTRAIGLERGLVQVQAPVGTFIAFSAGEGQTALDRLSDDDPEPYSVFTRYFLEELAKPQDLQSAFKATQLAVNRSAQSIGHPQRPAYYDEVIGSACLTGKCKPELADPAKLPPETPPSSAEKVLVAQIEWQDFKETTSVEALLQFAERHAGTPYAALASDKARVLMAAQTPERTPLPPPETPKTPPPEEPASFSRPKWCPAAATRTERRICDSKTLSALDLRMSGLYFARLKRQNDAGRQAMKARQKTMDCHAKCLRVRFQMPETQI